MITTCTVYHAIRTIAIWLQQPISIQHPMFDIKQQLLKDNIPVDGQKKKSPRPRNGTTRNDAMNVLFRGSLYHFLFVDLHFHAYLTSTSRTR
jgi:hypothetical protein